MDKFIALVVPDEKKAYECLRILETLDREGNVTLYATAVVSREANGSLTIKQRSDVGPVGAALGAMLGALIGLVGGPLGVLAGAAGGGAAGTVGQYGVHADLTDEFAEDVTRELKPGTFAVLAEVQEEWTAPLDLQVAPLGAKIVRETRAAFTEDVIERRINAERAEFHRFKTDRASAKAERMQSALEGEIQSMAVKLQRRAETAQKRLAHAKQELEAKIKRLEEQASKASPDVKSRIEQRIAEVRTDFDNRSEKLQRAYQITQEALRL